MAYIWTWIWPWLLGLLFSLIVGHFVTATFLIRLRKWMGPPVETLSPLTKEVPTWITGVVERLIFMIMVGASVDGFPTAMIGWLALKLATNWNHPSMVKKPEWRAFAMSALLAGAISMLFALGGGFITKKLLPGN